MSETREQRNNFILRDAVRSAKGLILDPQIVWERGVHIERADLTWLDSHRVIEDDFCGHIPGRRAVPFRKLFPVRLFHNVVALTPI